MTAYGNRPRSLCCFDFKSTKLEWEQPVGPMLQNCEIDFGKGGRVNAFICGSKAVDNGNLGPDGSDDSHADAFAFSEKGEPLWYTELGGAGSEVIPLVPDLGANSQKTIFAWVHNDEAIHGSGSSEIGRIVELSHQGQIQRQAHVGACLESCVVADLLGKSSPQVLCTDCLGDLHVLNGRLEEVFRKNIVGAERRKLGKLGRVDLRIIGAAKLLASEEKQLVLRSVRVAEDKRGNPGRTSRSPDVAIFIEPKILVLDARFNQIAEFPFQTKTNGWMFSWQVKTADIDGDGLDEILSLSDRCEILKLLRR